MALHPDFPESPHAILDPEVRWFPADEALRDTKRIQKRGKNLEKLKIIIRSIVAEEPLDAIHRDHKLIGNWKGRRECHIESDWLLVYRVDGWMWFHVFEVIDAQAN